MMSDCSIRMIKQLFFALILLFFDCVFFVSFILFLSYMFCLFILCIRCDHNLRLSLVYVCYEQSVSTIFILFFSIYHNNG